jgi:hypothetical protein
MAHASSWIRSTHWTSHALVAAKDFINSAASLRPEVRRIISAVEMQIQLGNTVLIDYVFVFATLYADGGTHWLRFEMRRIGVRIE